MDDDDIPPLEDMTTLVDQVKEKQKLQNPTTKSFEHVVDEAEPAKPCKMQSQEKSNVGFGGMKKGFLFGNSTAKSSKRVKKSAATSKTDYEVKASSNKKKLVFDEVQEAMNESKGLPAGTEWVTADLLKKVEGNEALSRKLADPKFSRALQWMQSDPKAAKEYYKNDKDVQEFFMDFYKILGQHFTALGEQTNSSKGASSQPKSEDEVRFEKILGQPEIKAILAKPSIKHLFTVLREMPEKGQHLFRSSDDELKADVQKLTEVGLLSFTTRPSS